MSWEHKSEATVAALSQDTSAGAAGMMVLSGSELPTVSSEAEVEHLLVLLQEHQIHLLYPEDLVAVQVTEHLQEQ